MRLRRNTQPAREQAGMRARDRRIELRHKVRKLLRSFCLKSPPCAPECRAIPVTDCMSYRNIAENLNERRIDSARGKIGTWQSIMVTNIFKDEDESSF